MIELRWNHDGFVGLELTADARVTIRNHIASVMDSPATWVALDLLYWEEVSALRTASAALAADMLGARSKGMFDGVASLTPAEFHAVLSLLAIDDGVLAERGVADRDLQLSEPVFEHLAEIADVVLGDGWMADLGVRHEEDVP